MTPKEIITETLKRIVVLYREYYPNPFYFDRDVVTVQRFLQCDDFETTRTLACINQQMDWNTNTGICYMVAKYAKSYLKDVHGIETHMEFLHMDEGEELPLFLHCFLNHEGTYFDTLIPEGKTDWRMMFMADEPETFLSDQVDPIDFTFKGESPADFFDYLYRHMYPYKQPALEYRRYFPSAEQIEQFSRSRHSNENTTQSVG
jgi:hypothetical protein